MDLFPLRGCLPVMSGVGVLPAERAPARPRHLPLALVLAALNCEAPQGFVGRAAR